MLDEKEKNNPAANAAKDFSKLHEFSYRNL